jgi:hypothetical protein
MRREIAGCERFSTRAALDTPPLRCTVRNVLSASLSIPPSMQKADEMVKNNKFG